MSDGYHTFSTSFGRHSLDKRHLREIAQNVTDRLTSLGNGVVTPGEILEDTYPELSDAEVSFVLELFE